MWLTLFTQAVVPGLSLAVGLFAGLSIDRSLQHYELSIADQHAAYTEFLNAADDLLTYRYVHWQITSDLMGTGGRMGPGSSMVAGSGDNDVRAPEAEKERALRDAANQLRLVIDSEDAPLITSLVTSLDIDFPQEDLRRDELYIYWPNPPERMAIYSNAKFRLVDEFRQDILKEEPLPDSERHTTSELDMALYAEEMAAAEAAHQAKLDELSGR